MMMIDWRLLLSFLLLVKEVAVGGDLHEEGRSAEVNDSVMGRILDSWKTLREELFFFSKGVGKNFLVLNYVVHTKQSTRKLTNIVVHFNLIYCKP